MPSESISPNMIWLEETDSTNRETRRRSAGLSQFCGIAARKQLSGKGQGDHVWISEPGKNLTFSLIFRPSGLQAKDVQLISCAVSLGILDYLRDKGVTARIKWPNDIWVGDRKICGMLIENILDSSNVRESVIGVGFNLNQKEWPQELPNPVSLSQLTGVRYSTEAELGLLQECICRRCILIESAGGRISLQGEYGDNVFRLV